VSVPSSRKHAAPAEAGEVQELQEAKSVMNRIAIIMDGGIIQNILTDEEVDITIVDYDTEDAEEKDLTEVPQNDGTSVEAFVGYPNADLSDEARKFLDRLNKAGEHDHQSEPG
jgi:hypothetical protein